MKFTFICFERTSENSAGEDFDCLLYFEFRIEVFLANAARVFQWLPYNVGL